MAKYQTSVASYATQLKEVEKITSSKSSISAICYSHNYPTNKHLVNTVIENSTYRLNKIMKYGRESYTYGLPNGYISSNEVINQDDVVAAIKVDTGLDVNIQTAFIDNPDGLTFARSHGKENWGFVLDASNEGQGYMKEPPIGYAITNGSYDNRQTGITRGHKSTILAGTWETNGDLTITISLEYHEATTENGFDRDAYYDTYNIRVKKADVFNPSDIKKKYYQVRYVPEGSVDENHGYWFYENGSGVFPELDNLDSDLGQQFLPIIPLREYNKNLGPTIKDGEYVLNDAGTKILPDTELYKTSNRLLEKTGLDMDSLCLSVAQNPDVGDIDHVYVTFAIDIRTETKEGKKYIYQFFKQLALTSPNKSDLAIQDASYNVHIEYDSSTLLTKIGNIGDDTNLIYQNESDTLIIQKQINESEYEEITVVNLKHINYIYKNHNEITSLEMSANEDNFGFLIPLQYNLVKENRSLFGRNDLIDESMVMVFNCYERRKLKWYETGIFKFIMIVIAVIVIVWTGGAASIAASLTSAFTSIQGLIMLAGQLLVGYAVKEGLAWAVEELGIEWAAALAVVIAILAVYTGNFGLADDALGLATSDGLLSIVSGISANLTVVSSSKIEDLQKEMESISSYIQKEEDALKELEDELYEVGLLSIDDILNREHIDFMNEKPEDFYNRTIHAGNVGTLVYEIIPNYVESKITLPELNKIE